MIELTKIDVAEAQIRTAVKLFFENAHPVPVHTLACAAREIVATLGQKLGIKTILEEVADNLLTEKREVLKKATAFVNFMKHADRDPQGVLKNFSDTDNDPILFFACQDFGRVTGGMPIEAQVYEAWYFATSVKRVSEGARDWQKLVKACIKHFPRVRVVGRDEQKKIGLHALEQALKDPKLRMEFKRTVDLPIANA